MSSHIQQFDALLASHEFVFAVYYRGHWCPFCVAYLKSLQSLTASIAAAGGKVVAITSEPTEHLAATRRATGFDGEVIVDPENELAAELKRRKLLDVAISAKGGYEHGMAQPAVLVLNKEGTVLFSWAIVPGMMNLGGAKDRPDLTQIWENVQAKMKGQPEVHQKCRGQTFTGVMWHKIVG